MSYRDDEEARRQRIEALETELAGARADHAKTSEVERESEERKEELEVRIAKLEKELAAARHEPPPEPPPEPPRPAVPRPPLWARIKSGLGWIPLVGVVLAFGTCGYFGIHENRPSCEALDDNVFLIWSAEVVSVTGVNVPVGEHCEVRSEFFANRDGELSIDDSDIQIECGNRVVFEGDGGGCSVMQVRKAGSQWHYAVPNCNFYGDDDVTLQWVTEQMTLSSSEPAWQIQLRVAPEAVSRFALYDPEGVDARFTTPFESPAEVIVLSGRPPVALGDRCTVTLAPPPSDDVDECTATVRCGERTLRSTSADCEVESGRPVSASGPGIDIDIERGVARVFENGGPGDPYAASLRLGE